MPSYPQLIQHPQRQGVLSHRVSRVSKVPLKRQSTAVGLSVVAITYYIVGLIRYLAKGAESLGWLLGTPHRSGQTEGF